MARFLKDRSKKRGAAPGSAIFIGEQKVEKTTIQLMDYTPTSLNEQECDDTKPLDGLVSTDTSSWINVCGLHDEAVVSEVGEAFGLHSIVIEEVLNTGQRPTFIDYDDYLFLAVKMLNYNEEKDRLQTEHVSFVIGQHYLLTFQEMPGDVFEQVRERIRKQKTKIRTRGVDYLCYALVDAIVDEYIHVIERFGDKIEVLEGRILSKAQEGVLEKINEYKREMSYLRKVVRPVREASLQFSKSDSGLIQKKTTPFLKDLEGLTSLAAEAIETYSEILSDQLNIYQTSVSNKLNDVMKVLTIFSVIFIPLTFIAGIYGTNFEYLPELKYHYAYPVFWAVLVSVALAMVYYFRRKRWI